jgi:predicted RNase H-like HicB family nuclease
MRIQNEEERQAAQETLKEVMQKLEEAWRLAREIEDQHGREHAGAAHG